MARHGVTRYLFFRGVDEGDDLERVFWGSFDERSVWGGEPKGFCQTRNIPLESPRLTDSNGGFRIPTYPPNRPHPGPFTPLSTTLLSLNGDRHPPTLYLWTHRSLSDTTEVRGWGIARYQCCMSAWSTHNLTSEEPDVRGARRERSGAWRSGIWVWVWVWKTSPFAESPVPNDPFNRHQTQPLASVLLGWWKSGLTSPSKSEWVSEWVRWKERSRIWSRGCGVWRRNEIRFLERLWVVCF